MAAQIIPLILPIILEGMKIFSRERKNRFVNKHHKILERINNAENAKPPSYSDAELGLAREELETFIKAFHHELKEHNAENNNSSNSN